MSLGPFRVFHSRSIGSRYARFIRKVTKSPTTEGLPVPAAPALGPSFRTESMPGPCSRTVWNRICACAQPGLQRVVPLRSCAASENAAFTLLGVHPPGNSPGTEPFDASTESPTPFSRLVGFALGTGRHLHNLSCNRPGRQSLAGLPSDRNLTVAPPLLGFRPGLGADSGSSLR